MRVYQAVWNPSGELFIWGEKGSSLNDFIKNSSLVPEEFSEDIPNHPFCCNEEQIDEDIAALEYAPDEYQTIEVNLPSDRFGPVPAPKLIAASELEREPEPTLKKWRVRAACFKPLPAASFLTSIPAELPAGIKLDDSVFFWREATKLILDLLCRGRFVAGTKQENNRFAARWFILPSEDADKSRLEVIARALPPICQRFCQTDFQTGLSPEELTDSFVFTVSDALIRGFLKNYALIPSVQIRFPSVKTLVAQEWLKALTSPSGVIEAPTPELISLDQKIRHWNGRLFSSFKKVDLRIGFDLVSPQSDPLFENSTKNQIWYVQFYLYLSKNKSERLYPNQIWSGDTGILKNSELTAEELEEFFLKNLGQASNVFPELKEALFEAHPTRVTLTTEGAYRFLKNTSVLLEQAGFTVTVPSWWKTPTAKIGLNLNITPPDLDYSTLGHKSHLGLNQLLECTWQVAIGDTKLSIEEFREMVSKQTPLIKVNDEWVELNPERISATLAFLEERANDNHLTVLEALRMGYGISADDAMLPIVNFNTEGWLEQLVSAAAGSVPPVEQPFEFEGSLRHYQQEGVSWMSFLSRLGLGCCLADDMGLGKTIQFLALLLHERETTPDDMPPIEATLLIAPMSILDNWHNEAKRFAPQLKVYLHHGPTRLSGEDFIKQTTSSDLVITSYSLAHRDEELIGRVSWGRMALDEAQNIKNLGTKQTQAIRRIVQKQLHNPQRTTVCQRMALTGTPLENHLEELWSIMDFLNSSYLGSLSTFRAKFAIPIERYRSKEAAQTLAKVIRPFILRRLKTDPQVISDLPEKIEMIENTSLTPEQATLYQHTLNQLLPQVDQATGIHRKGLVLATITRLKQICNHPALGADKDTGEISNRSGKLARLEELLEVILDGDDKALIFTQYAQMGTILKNHLQERFGTEVLFLHGGLQKSARAKLVDRFQQPDGPKVFVLSLKAGGFGLNLTQANQVIHYDQWWNPAVEDQATDRAFRIGQKRNVQVRKFICQGTLEERIAEMLMSKKGLADQIVGATKNAITQLSSDELRSLLELTQEPVLSDNE